MNTSYEIIARMREVAPPGNELPRGAALDILRRLTRELAAATPGARQEYERFTGIQQRSIGLAARDLDAWLRGKAIVVTGGTGCIGSRLMTQLEAFGPARLVSMSRGSASRWPRLRGAEYACGDVRDRCRLDAVFANVRPDVVFHVAAQRNPGLAEIELHRTVTTNLLGTRNVLAAASAAGVPQVIAASTGKALRPYSPDIYTASKRAAEWLLSEAAHRTLVSAARFTHVVDNSIIHDRLFDWCKASDVIRLHSEDIVFYAQSALESAQLLLAAGLAARPGSLMVHAITDLGRPVSLLDAALGLLEVTGSQSPVWFGGYDQGYEETPFPALYDPLTAGDVSPLLNAFEAARAMQGRFGAVDAFPLEMAAGSWPTALLLALEETCMRTEDPAQVRAALDDMSWSLLDAALEAVPRQVLARAVKLAGPHRLSLTAEHARMLGAIEQHAAVEEAAPA